MHRDRREEKNGKERRKGGGEEGREGAGGLHQTSFRFQCRHYRPSMVISQRSDYDGEAANGLNPEL